MASLHPLPPGCPVSSLAENGSSSASSSSAAGAQLTPDSNRSEAGYYHPGSPSNPYAGKLALKTDFGDLDEDDQAEIASFLDEDNAKTDDDQADEEQMQFQEFISRRGGGGGGASSALVWTTAEEKEVVKRFDRQLVPFLAFLYLLSFLDRSNIGNAKIAGLSEELPLSSSQYEWLLTIFYVTYILFEWMTLMYQVVPPHIYISLCVCGWGLAASLQSLATSFGTLMFLRALLGFAEAAFGPGVPFYLSHFYKREELAFRIGLFISAAPLATSFASSLAWLIVRLSSQGPISPWRMLFLVEGFPSVAVAFFAWVLIPDSPGRARFLSPRQRRIAGLRLEEAKKDIHGARSGGFNWKEVARALRDPKCYLMAFMYFSCNVAFSSMPVFLPTILKDMGYSSLQSQALSAPPYLVAFIVVLLTAFMSDRSRSRSTYLIIHGLLSSFAYFVIAATGYFHAHMSPAVHTFIRYICVYPAVSGFFSCIVLIITWSMDNRIAKEGKGTSVVIMNVIGQFGPILGTRLYPQSNGPWYVQGMATCSFFMALVALLALALRIILQRSNAAVAGGNADDIEMEETEEALGLMGGTRAKLQQAERLTYII